LSNALEHTVGIRERFIVPETKHAVAEALQARGTLRIVVSARRMLPTVELDDQLPLPAAEVDDVGADRDLARELHAEQAPIS